jgi:hypothetical protein
MSEADRVTGLRKVLDITDLAAPVAWLDAYAGVTVSVLQGPPEYRHLQPPVLAPGKVCLHDHDTLRPEILDCPTGWIRRARISRSDPRRVTVCSWPDSARALGHPSVVDVWDLDRRQKTSRTFPKRVDDATPWRDRILLGVFEAPWSARHGAKVRVWDAALERSVDELDEDDAGFEVVAAGDVIAATGIHLHVWRPDRNERAFSLGDWPFAPPGEMGPCAIADDGSRVAVVCDRRRAEEAQVMLLRSENLTVPPVLISDETRRNVEHACFSPDGSMLAVSLSESPCVRVHRTEDGALVGETMLAGQRAIAWLDRRRLLIGGETLSVWSVVA